MFNLLSNRAVLSAHASERIENRDIVVPDTILDKLDRYKAMLTEDTPIRFVEDGITYVVGLKNDMPVVVSVFRANYAEHKQKFERGGIRHDDTRQAYSGAKQSSRSYRR